MARQLRVTSERLTADDIRKEHSFLHGQDVEFKYIRPVRWWQVWRWHQLWSPDYHLSRADEHWRSQWMDKTIQQVTSDIRRARGEMADAQGSGPCSP